MKDYTTYIFDLDGTITDTLTVWLGIFRDCLLHFGITPPDDQSLSQHTHDWKQMLQLGLPEDRLEDFITLAHTYAGQRLPHAPLHEHALETLQTLKQQGKRIAIFSTLDRPIFEPAMHYRHLGEIAEAAIAGTDVQRRKPHPDGILRALEDLNIPKEQYGHAVYIGDKDTDILAAQNAGIDSVLYFPPSHQAIYDIATLAQHNPTHIINDWQELLQSPLS